MKEILDRHAEHLSPAHKAATWQAILDARGRGSRRAPRPALRAAVALATLAAAFALAAWLRPHAPGGRAPLAARPAAPVTRIAPPAPQAAARASEARDAGRGPLAAQVAPPATSHATATAPAHARGVALPPVAHAARAAIALPSSLLATAAPPAALRRPGDRAALPPVVQVAQVVPALAAASSLLVNVQVPAPPGTPPGTLVGRVTDAHGQPLAFATVSIPSVHRGGLTDSDGRFAIPNLPAGAYDVRVQLLGFRPAQLSRVPVGGEQPVALDVRLQDVVVRHLSAVEVTTERHLVEAKQGAAVRGAISADQLKKLPVDNLSQLLSTQAGLVARGGDLHFRGGRGGEVKYQYDGVTGKDPAFGGPTPPVVPTTGGTALPNDEAFDSMFFKNYGVNPFVPADEAPLSTFAVDVDAGSYTLSRRYLGLGQLPPADAVRVEEFVNFFAQGYPAPEHDDFRVVADGAPSPFRPGYELLRIGIRGRDVDVQGRRPAHLTFVIDVSGSMSREDRLELVKRALRMLVRRLRDDDEVGIVVFGSDARVLLEPRRLGRAGAGLDDLRDVDEDARVHWDSGRQRILDAIDQLRPEGSTNTEEGLRLGYELARRAFSPGANNRIVLCSDGVANVGRTGPDAILAAVRTDADRGIALSTVGFGMGNYNDVLMEQLADKGGGAYAYVDDLREARRVFVENLTGTLQAIARDAKVQVEFDSTRVLRYRLLGFENRAIADRDFRNDKVAGGAIGSGHEVTALYEVKLVPNAARGRVAMVHLRWARPEHEGAGAPETHELERQVGMDAFAPRFEVAAPRLRLDAAAAQFAEILRHSYWAKDSKLTDVLAVARHAAADVGDAPADELANLVATAAKLAAAKPPAQGSSEH